MSEQVQAANTEWVDIVDEQNEVIAQSSRQQMRAQRLRHRAYIVVQMVWEKSWYSIAPISRTSIQVSWMPLPVV